ncbi:MAG: molybdenum cofactor biosynthesis protein MoaE [Alphaproteobacteria bacterium]|nr:molybdenum cofactor biosynthesis protein MoaE [Alphaproteobacteria bacterium]
MIRVQGEDFDIGAEIAALSAGNHAIGGIASFIGTVRASASHEGSKSEIGAITLEHYPGMTERQLEAIEAEAKQRWALDAVLIIHRYGRLEPGERIVLVVTASSHRQAALESCAFLIDWLKTKAPFWKLEDSRDGGAHWVEARASDDQAAERWTTPPKAAE